MTPPQPSPSGLARPARQRLRTAGAAGAMAVVLAAVVGCASSIGGQAALPGGLLASAGVATPTASTTSVTTSRPPTTSSTVSSGSSSAPIDLTTGSSTVDPPGTDVVGPPQTRPTTAPPASVTIINDSGSAADQLAKDAIADVTAYWAGVSPEVFGKELPPIKGGYYSVDPDSKTDKIPGCLDSPADIRNNAVYCPDVDAIVYDRVYLARITKDYSELDVALTFAHEFGHALQHRFVPVRQRSIVLETQADCFAGVWAKSVTDGKNPHFAFDQANLDRVLGDYIWEMGDPAGTDPNHQQAHGSVFDRVSATQEGYLDGAASCVNNFNDKRVFTAEKFDKANASTDGQGNLDLATTITSTTDELDRFWGTRFGAAGSGTFTPPAVNQDKKGNAACSDEFVVSYCKQGNSIDLKPMAKLAEIHKSLGDLSTGTAIALAYTEYVQGRYGTESQVAPRICTAGAFTADLFTQGVLSPGDFDEAVKLLVLAGKDNVLVDTGDTTAWDRIDAFRAGIYQGLAACHLK